MALGGSLHQRLQDLPDRMDHSTPMQPSLAVRQAKAHAIRVTPGGWLHRLAGTTEIAVNSLHNQGIDQLAPGLVAEGIAPDGTIEAVRVAASQAGPALGFAVGVQWHPEYDWRSDPLSKRHLRSVWGRRPRLCRLPPRLMRRCSASPPRWQAGAPARSLLSVQPVSTDVCLHRDRTVRGPD